MSDNIDINSVHKELARKDFIVFAGAGVVTGTGVPNSWKRLLKTLSGQASIDIDTDKISEAEYADKAQEIFEVLCRQGKKDRYYETIKEQLTATESSWSEKAFEILLTAKGVVTTNFDNIFEASYTRLAEADRDLPPNISTDSLPDFNYEDDFRRHKIVYLHGRANENYIVFKKDDYSVYYPTVCNSPNGDDCVEKYLDFVYCKHTIVFVGFSFDDVYVRTHLKHIYEKLVARDQRCSDKIGYREIVPKIEHYAFLWGADSNNKNYRQRKAIEAELEGMKIRVVYYRERREWMDCFEKIRRARPVKLELGNSDGEST
jgi:hypothetical protein